MGTRYRTLDFLGWGPYYRVGTDGTLWTRIVMRGRGLGSGIRGVYPHVGAEWKIMPGYDPYDGPRGRVTRKLGYRKVVLRFSGKRKCIFVHHLVLLAFVGPCPKGMVCRHFPDANPSNNRLENLQWGTPKENTADRIVHGTDFCRERHPMHKLTESQIAHMRQLYSEEPKWKKPKKWSLRALASHFGISLSQACRIVRNESWK